MSDLKKTIARSFLEVNVTCPNCMSFHEVLDNVRAYFKDGELRSDGDIDIEVLCPDCKENFIITEVVY